MRGRIYAVLLGLFLQLFSICLVPSAQNLVYTVIARLLWRRVMKEFGAICARPERGIRLQLDGRDWSSCEATLVALLGLFSEPYGARRIDVRILHPLLVAPCRSGSCQSLGPCARPERGIRLQLDSRDWSSCEAALAALLGLFSEPCGAHVTCFLFFPCIRFSR